MRKIVSIAGSVLMLLLSVAVTGCREHPASHAVGIEVLDVGRRQATVVWSTTEPEQGKVHYRLATGPQAPLSATETLSKSYRHRVQLPNLIPGARYTYWIDGAEQHYQFQTQPEGNTPFSFLLLTDKQNAPVKNLVMAEVPDFILDLSQTSHEGKDPFQQIRPYLPVFDQQGTQSPFLARRDESPVPGPGSRADGWQLNWGGLQLMMVGKPAALASLPDPVNADHSGIVLLRSFFDTPAMSKAAVERIPATDFHRRIHAYNGTNRKHPVTFVLLPSDSFWQQKADGISYLGLPLDGGGKEASPVRMDIDHNSVMAILLDNRERIVLRAPPLQTKITCEDCRRLADRGAYEAAIRSYRSFIDNNGGHYQIDDAYLAVAEIYDEKLFHLESARTWYQMLVAQYPDSVLSPLARQRLKQLAAHADFDFEPLMRFEKIRKIEFAKQKESSADVAGLLKDVEQILVDFPKASIAPQILNWLGVQYRGLDIDRSVSSFLKLKREYPTAPEAQEALMNVGSTYYGAGKYKKALSSYRTALAQEPHLAETLKSRIKRSGRNLRRVRIFHASLVIFFGVSLLGLACRPMGLSASHWKHATAAMVAMCLGNVVAAWLIREQFSSNKEMFQMVFFLSLSAAWAGVVGPGLSEKFFSSSVNAKGRFVGVARLAAGICTGLLVLLAGFYLSIYWIYEHYLIIVKL